MRPDRQYSRSACEGSGWRKGKLTLGAEQLRQQIDELAALVTLGVMQGLLRSMQEFGGETFGQGFQYLIDIGALGQHATGTFQLGLTQRLATVMQILNQRHHGTVIDPVHERLHPGFDDGLGLRDGSLTVFDTALYHRGEIIHGVEEDVIQARNFRLDITWHRQINHENRFVTTCLDGALDHS